MAELYCNPCGGTVNAGGLCPHAKRPNDCPLKKSEKFHAKDFADDIWAAKVVEAGKGAV